MRHANNIAVREADIERDAMVIQEGAKDFAKRMHFGDLLGDDRSAMETVKGLANDDSISIWVAVKSGRVVGGMCVAYLPFLWNRSVTIAEHVFWWTKRDAPFGAARVLMLHAMKDIQKRGAVPMFREPVGTRLGRAYERFGMKAVETIYTGAVS